MALHTFLNAFRYTKDLKKKTQQQWLICEQRRTESLPPALTLHAHRFLGHPASHPLQTRSLLSHKDNTPTASYSPT